MTEYIHVSPEDRTEPRSNVIKLHGPEAFEGMRRARRLAAEILDGVVPHFADQNKEESAKKLLYVICSRPRKNLHLISETGRINGLGDPYGCTAVLAACQFDYDQIPAPVED